MKRGKRPPTRICPLCAGYVRIVDGIVTPHSRSRLRVFRCPTIGYPFAAAVSLARRFPFHTFTWH